jgi:5,10-methenyltetrahydromethanopterin hydrogenase
MRLIYMKNETVYEEPMYDDDTLELLEELETTELIEALLHNTRDLEKMIIELREEVNSLTPKGQRKPYIDLHSDIYKVFYDFTAYSKHEEIFKILERE